MRESDGRLRSVMDNAADAIITIDEHGLIESFNHAASVMFGYTSEEILGGNVSVLIAEPHRSRHDGYVGNYVRTGNARIFGIGLRELTAVNKDGTEFPMELSVAESRSGGKHIFIGRSGTSRTQAGTGAAPAGPEDGSDRPAYRWRGPRFQQYADHDRRQPGAPA